jgi:hypothetical protein
MVLGAGSGTIVAADSAADGAGGGGIDGEGRGAGATSAETAGASGLWRSVNSPTAAPMSAATPATMSTDRPVLFFGIETRALVPGIVGFMGPALA